MSACGVDAGGDDGELCACYIGQPSDVVLALQACGIKPVAGTVSGVARQPVASLDWHLSPRHGGHLVLQRLVKLHPEEGLDD